MMQLWSLWVSAIDGLLQTLATDLGLGLGLAVIAGTVVFRALLLPLSWSCAYRNRLRQKKLARLRPQLERLKAVHAQDPQAHARQVMQLHREHGLGVVDGRGLLCAVVQMPLFLGMFQALRALGNGVRFLWVENLGRPDLGLALLAGVATALAMLVAPDLPEQLRFWLVLVPGVLTLLAALKVGSALAIYWAVSNCFSALQTVVLNFVVERRVRAGSPAV